MLECNQFFTVPHVWICIQLASWIRTTIQGVQFFINIRKRLRPCFFPGRSSHPVLLQREIILVLKSKSFQLVTQWWFTLGWIRINLLGLKRIRGHKAERGPETIILQPVQRWRYVTRQTNVRNEDVGYHEFSFDLNISRYLRFLPVPHLEQFFLTTQPSSSKTNSQQSQIYPLTYYSPTCPRCLVILLCVKFYAI